MRKRLLLVVIVAAVVASVGTLSLLGHRAAPSHATGRTHAVAEDAPTQPPVPGRRPSRMVRVDSASAEAWNLPLADVEPGLRALAATGDTAAAFALGSRAADCMKQLREKTREELIEEQRDERRWIDGLDNRDSLAEVRKQNVEGRLRRELAYYDDCAEVGEKRLSDYLVWLERAGRAGHKSARIAYAAHAFGQWEKPLEMVADIEEAVRRRTLARTWLEDLVAAGNESALAAYVAALDGKNGLYARDEDKRAIHSYVLDLVQSRRIRGFDESWAAGPYIPSAPEWTPERVARIKSEGHRIYQEHFRDTPLWP